MTICEQNAPVIRIVQDYNAAEGEGGAVDCGVAFLPKLP